MITAIVFVKADVARIPEVAEEIADLDGVSEVYSVTGQIDLIALVRVRDHDDVADVVADRLNKVARRDARPRPTSRSGPTPSTTSSRRSRSASTTSFIGPVFALQLAVSGGSRQRPRPTSTASPPRHPSRRRGGLAEPLGHPLHEGTRPRPRTRRPAPPPALSSTASRTGTALPASEPRVRRRRCRPRRRRAAPRRGAAPRPRLRGVEAVLRDVAVAAPTTPATSWSSSARRGRRRRGTPTRRRPRRASTPAITRAIRGVRAARRPARRAGPGWPADRGS